VKIANLHLRGVILPIVKYSSAKKFLEHVKKILETSDDYEMYILTEKPEAIFYPTVSTSRKRTIWFTECSPDDKNKIKEEMRKFPDIPVIEVDNFFFDEKREPSYSVRY